MGAMDRSRKSTQKRSISSQDHLLALLGRGKAYEEASGQRDAAIADDYSAVLTLDGTLWEALASRGVLFYEAGCHQESLADFDAAIKLKPEVVELHENRAIVVADIEALQAVPQVR